MIADASLIQSKEVTGQLQMVFKIDTGGPSEWMPPHYVALSDVSIASAAQRDVTPMSWGMEIARSPEPFVKHLSSAASKYRLASVCEGLFGRELEGEPWSKIGASYFDSYSAQALVMLTFVAVESHLRMLGTKWQKFPIHRTTLSTSDLANLLRDDLGKNAFTKLANAMTEDRLKKRLGRFWDGDDSEVLAVVSALRNAFSHGKAGVNQSISLECAQSTRDILLGMVRSDSEIIVRSLETQDKSLLILQRDHPLDPHPPTP